MLVPKLGYFVSVGLFCFEWVNCSNMNPLHPDISLYILHTVLCTKVQIREFVEKLKASLAGVHFLYFCDLNV